jgi:membrane protease YdiL (CAAX protease family)
MKAPTRWSLLGTVLAGLGLFALVIGACQGLAAFNASTTPGIPWFPLPALILLAVAVAFAKGRWDLRLTHPPGVPWARAYGFALLGTLAAMGISVLEAWFNGLTRSAPAWPGVQSTAFNLAFLITLPFVASVMAEIAFRGIIQTVLEKVWPIWTVLLAIAAINGLMHLYDPDQMSQWARFLSLNLVWGYVTWRSRSLLPALTAHVVMNVIEPGSEYLWGPTDMGALSATTLAVTGTVTLMSLLAALWLLRSWPRA